jgi:hypothetical protein
VAVFPDIAQLTAPVLCHGQKLVSKTTNYSRYQGSSSTQTILACVDATGASTEVGAFLVVLVITLPSRR